MSGENRNSNDGINPTIKEYLDSNASLTLENAMINEG